MRRAEVGLSACLTSVTRRRQLSHSASTKHLVGVRGHPASINDRSQP